VILDLASGGWTRESRYPSRFFDLNGATVCILGADAATAEEIERHLQGTVDLGREAIRELHRRVPGTYALIAPSATQTIVATDPYGIVKLYWMRREGLSMLSDDAYAFRDRPFTLDRNAIQYFMIRGYTPSRHTYFRELAKLEPCTLHRFEGGALVDSGLYADLRGPMLDHREFFEEFERVLTTEVEQYVSRYGSACLCLSGGIDSSLLYKLIRTRGIGDDLVTAIARLDGLGQKAPIDGDFDVAYARRLAAEHGDELRVVPYDIRSEVVASDFTWLRRNLFTEYAPAFAYVGLGRTLEVDRLVVNGQNADSVLSFGSMGTPRFQGLRLTGLQGVFGRYSHFYDSRPRLSPVYAAASLLRSLYYWRNPEGAPREYSDHTVLLGLGLHPENKFFASTDPAFGSIANPAALATWFDAEYLTPLTAAHGDLTHHARAMLVYNKTYMQGAANRSTVLSHLLQGRKVFLPYTGLALFELMCRLAPDWRFAVIGKYPNVALGRDRLGLPSYILNRSDPVDSDSTQLIFARLSEHEQFGPFLQSVLEALDPHRYRDILHPRTLERLQRLKTKRESKDLPLIMRMAWLESTFSEFQVE
jgi:hypothetical protein